MRKDKELEMLRLLWRWPAPAEVSPWGLSSYMDLDTTFGEKIAVVCATMRWSEQDWEFFFHRADGGFRIDKDRTPRSYGWTNTNGRIVDCVSEANEVYHFYVHIVYM